MRQLVDPRHRVSVIIAVVLGLSFAAPVVAAPGVTGIDIQLPVGARITGTITDSVGSPLIGATVDACADTTGQCEFDQTASDGRYEVVGLAPDLYRVQVSPPDGSDQLFGYYTPSGPVPEFDQAALIDVTSGDVSGIDLALDSGVRITGTIRDPDGTAIEGLEIVAQGGGGFAISDASGAFEIRAVPPGEYAMEVRNRGLVNYLSGTVVDGVVSDRDADGTPIIVGTEDVTGVDIVDPPGFRLAGTLSGAPTPTSGAVIVSADGDPFAFGVNLSPTGAWTIAGLRPGSYKLAFQVDAEDGGGSFLGYWRSDGTLTQDFDAGTFVEIVDADIVGLDATVPPAPSVRGRVIGEDGAPLAHAFVQMCAGPAGCLSGFSALDGSFRFDRVPSGSWILFAGARDHVTGYYGPNGFTLAAEDATPIKVGRRSVDGITVVLPSGFEISGRITGQDGEGVPDVQVSRSGGIDPSGGGVTRTQADGTYRIGGIVPGDYTISVSDLHGTGFVAGHYNADDPGGYTADFDEATVITIPADPPAIVSASPAPGATIPAAGAVVTIRFDRFVIGVDGSSLSLWDGGKRLAASVSYDRSTSTATLRPRAPLKRAHAYEIRLAGSIGDLLGLQSAPTSWTFTTLP